MNQLNIKEIKRGIKPDTKVLLFAVTAGRCEICNELIIKDENTNRIIIWGEMAHIYAFSKGGARADNNNLHNNNIQNLLLACPNCHEKIDKKQQEKYYSPELLKEYKQKHESRIKLVSSFKDNSKTKVLKMVANINGELVKLTDYDIISALMPEKFYPCEDKFEEIDFTQTPGINKSHYWNEKKREIKDKVDKFYSDLARNKIEHISIFGIGPMPLLMYLGSLLNDKVKTKIFQRHRDGESWSWNKGKSEAVYKFKKVQEGKNNDNVALLISLSGFVNQELLPDNFKDCCIYELYLSPSPNYNFLRTEKDLHNFQKEYTSSISQIKNAHGALKCINVFPAVPAPVAIVCGRALNKNSDPKLKIYNTSLKSKFKYTLTIN